MVSGGLGYTDVGDSRVLGGFAREFANTVADHYGVEVGTYAGPEPHVAEEIFQRWLDESGVDVRFDASLTGVELSGNHITGVRDRAGSLYQAGVFVDASYEGDLLAASGVPYAVGREDRHKYGETFAGRREPAPGKHQFPPYLSPFESDGKSLLPLVHRQPIADVSAGDGGVMAYGFRVCLTRSADRLPFPRRPGYDPDEWELARRYLHWFEANGSTPRAEHFLGLVRNLPGEKCDGNSIGPISFNLLDGSNWAYPEATPVERDAIWQRHLRYTQDFLFFLSTDPEVPRTVRDGLLEWGLAPDEFTDTDGFPHQLYVREARRMIGEYVLTEHDLLPDPTPKYDTIAMGSYHIDIREVQRTWRWVYEHPDPIPEVLNEGYLSVPVKPYQIPYRSVVPRYADCDNLLVPVCLSASHVAFASVRMEPQYEMLGHAVGVAATLALRDDRPVQRVDLNALRSALLDDGQVLAL